MIDTLARRTPVPRDGCCLHAARKGMERRCCIWYIQRGAMAENILLDNPPVLKRLAKYMVQQCFRNTVLEDFHGGTTPGSQTGDYSNVVVKTPCGEIPWRRVSRLSDQDVLVQPELG